MIIPIEVPDGLRTTTKYINVNGILSLSLEKDRKVHLMSNGGDWLCTVFSSEVECAEYINVASVRSLRQAQSYAKSQNEETLKSCEDCRFCHSLFPTQTGSDFAPFTPDNLICTILKVSCPQARLDGDCGIEGIYFKQKGKENV
jgi:hypothetical protein